MVQVRDLDHGRAAELGDEAVDVAPVALGEQAEVVEVVGDAVGEIRVAQQLGQVLGELGVGALDPAS